MIAEILKKRRFALNKKTSEIAELVGVAESTYRDWENGRKIQGEPYKKIASALEFTVQELLEIEELNFNIILNDIAEIEKHLSNIRKHVM